MSNCVFIALHFVDNDVSDLKLPEFLNPPLAEVAISVQFEPLNKLVVPQIGLLWQHYGKEFPHVEHHPPIDPVIERFGVRSSSIFPNIQLLQAHPLPRVWFLNSAGDELLQLQQDRFVRNWRKVNPDLEYPRYETYIRPKFIDSFRDFEKFISDNQIGVIKANQCEVSYVNLITSNDVWTTHADIAHVFTNWDKEYSKDATYELEDARFQIRHLLRDQAGNFMGRLNITCEPTFASSKDQSPLFELRLIARLKPFDATLDGIMKSVDIGRESIVKTFAAITRKEMHDVWNQGDTRTGAN